MRLWVTWDYGTSQGHGIPQQQIDRIFEAGHKFMDLDEDVKEKFKWIPDRYLGWRSQRDLESVTGATWLCALVQLLPVGLLCVQRLRD